MRQGMDATEENKRQVLFIGLLDTPMSPITLSSQDCCSDLGTLRSANQFRDVGSQGGSSWTQYPPDEEDLECAERHRVAAEYPTTEIVGTKWYAVIQWIETDRPRFIKVNKNFIRNAFRYFGRLHVDGIPDCRPITNRARNFEEGEQSNYCPLALSPRLQLTIPMDFLLRYLPYVKGSRRCSQADTIPTPYFGPKVSSISQQTGCLLKLTTYQDKICTWT